MVAAPHFLSIICTIVSAPAEDSGHRARAHSALFTQAGPPGGIGSKMISLAGKNSSFIRNVGEYLAGDMLCPRRTA
jgi:hypothetical protein